MGITVAGTVEMGPALLSIPGNILALVEATIHRSHLKELDLATLQKNFPARMQIDKGGMVYFRGPVAIIQSVTAFKVALTALVGVAATFAAYFCSKGLLSLLSKHQVSIFAKWDEEKIHKTSMAIAALVGAAAGGAFYNLAPLPTKPSVYFYA